MLKSNQDFDYNKFNEIAQAIASKQDKPKASKQAKTCTLAQGTAISYTKSCSQLDAKPRASLGDRRMMRDYANVSHEDKCYQVPKDIPLFDELIRIVKLRYEREHQVGATVTMTSKEHQNLRRAIAKGDMHNVTKIIQRNITSNQVR